MREIEIVLVAYNAGKLDAELRAALGAKYSDLSTYGASRPISVRLADSTGPVDDDQVAAVCAAHDPTPIALKDADVSAALAAVPATGIADWLGKQDVPLGTLLSALLVRLIALETRVHVLDGK